METMTQDAPSFDLFIECDDEDTQGEVRADCGCVLERSEFSVGLFYCEMHRDAAEVRELLREAIEYAQTTYNEAEGDLAPHFVWAANSYGIEVDDGRGREK